MPEPALFPADRVWKRLQLKNLRNRYEVSIRQQNPASAVFQQMSGFLLFRLILVPFTVKIHIDFLQTLSKREN